MQNSVTSKTIFWVAGDNMCMSEGTRRGGCIVTFTIRYNTNTTKNARSAPVYKIVGKVHRGHAGESLVRFPVSF